MMRKRGGVPPEDRLQKPGRKRSQQARKECMNEVTTELTEQFADMVDISVNRQR